MPTAFSKMGSFSTGCLGSNGRIMLNLVDRGLEAKGTPHSLLVIWDKGKPKKPISVPWTTMDVVFPAWGRSEFVCIGRRGEVLLVDEQGQTTPHRLAEADQIARTLVCGASVVDQAIYAVGAFGSVWRIAEDGNVEDLSLPSNRLPDASGITLFSVEGFGNDEIYVAGDGGSLFRHDGQAWTCLKQLTDRTLTRMTTTPDGQVYAVGQGGVLMRGRGDAWTLLPTGVEEDLWDVRGFRDQLYVTSLNALYVWNGKCLEPSSLLENHGETFSRLDANPKVLLSVGPDDVYAVVAGKVLKVV